MGLDDTVNYDRGVTLGGKRNSLKKRPHVPYRNLHLVVPAFSFFHLELVFNLKKMPILFKIFFSLKTSKVSKTFEVLSNRDSPLRPPDVLIERLQNFVHHLHVAHFRVGAGKHALKAHDEILPTIHGHEIHPL